MVFLYLTKHNKMKKIKNILIVMSCLFFLKAAGQSNEKFDGKKWQAPYSLSIPKGWGIERFLIPIEFAPSIPYKGVEDIRFTPGWGKSETGEYWSYAFLWYLDNTATPDAKATEKNLIAYYTGLINTNVDKNKLDSIKSTGVNASIKKRATYKGDTKTFQGTVSMIDFLTLKPIVVNLVIHVRSCEGQDKVYFFYEVSPKPYTDSVWNGLDQLWTDFDCVKH